MDNNSTIQDYSMIDSFLSRSVDNYNKQLFGNYDDKTGYFQEVQPEEPQTEESQTQDTSEDMVSNDDSQSEMDMYNSVFGDENDFNSIGMSGGPGDKTPLSKQISNKESQGKYSATNPNSSATGKYQFLWSQWGDSIKKVTGVGDQKSFLTNPTAQEKFYKFYEKSYLLPEVQKIRKEIKTDLTNDQIAKLVHFRGEGGARKYLKGQASDKPETYNMSTSEYIKQMGGMPVARTKMAQHMGLNDDSLDSLMLPLQGENMIRGLDSGEPVMVQDELGNNTVLHGPHHTISMTGTVYEKRLKAGGKKYY